MPRNIVNEGLALKRKMFDESELDDLFKQAAEVVIQYDRASASLIQRRLAIGYARAARLIDQMESAGVLGPAEGAKPREVLIKSVKNLKIVKPEAKEEISELVYKYAKPKTDIIKNTHNIPWKKSLFDVINDPSYKKASDFSFPIGYEKDKLILKDLNNFTHLSITGNISSQKEGLLDTILVSLLMKLSHNELKLILIDGSESYLTYYDGLQHLLTPVITDPDKSTSALKWLMYEVNKRLKMFVQAGVRDIEKYNQAVKENKLGRILIVINRFEDILVYSPIEIGDSVTRLTSFAHETGIHFIITTDRLTKSEVPLRIQSNIPNKLFFRLTNKSDSGKVKGKDFEKLGKGEAILISDFSNEPQRIDAVFTSEENVKEAVKKIIESK